MKFSEFVRKYSNYKYKETGSRHVTESERANLMKEFNKLSEKKIDSRKSKVNESAAEERMSRFAEMRQAGKKTEPKAKYAGVVGKGPMKEKRISNESRRMAEEKKTTKNFSAMVSAYKNYKEEKTGDRSVSYKEIKALRESFEKNSLKTNEKPFSAMVSAYKKYKEEKTGDRSVSYKEIKALRESFEENALKTKKTKMAEESQISEKKMRAINKKLHEANFHVRRANRLLKENDMAGAEMSVDNATAAVDAVTDMTAGSPVPPEVQTQIQSVMTAVEQLASVSGLAPQNDMTSDIDANVAPAEGMGVVDEGSTMFERASLRRSTLLEEIDIPQAKKVAAGVSKYSGKTWKPAAIKYSKTGSLTENNTEREDEKMVDELLNEKTFNYKDLFAKGILG